METDKKTSSQKPVAWAQRCANGALNGRMELTPDHLSDQVMRFNEKYKDNPTMADVCPWSVIPLYDHPSVGAPTPSEEAK